jgi:hypothetical protein
MDTNSIILIGAIFVVIGFLLGLVVSSLSSTKKDDSSHLEREGVLKIWREMGKEELMVEFDNTKVDDRDILNPEQLNKIQEILHRLNKWFGPLPAHTPSLQDQQPEQTILPDQELPVEPESGFSFNPVEMFVKALQADVAKSKLTPESLITQIDDILQEKLKNSPLAGKPIRLMDFPGKGMVVMVGLDQYDSLDEVPDPKVKEIIRSAVREWEQQATEETD